MERPKLDKWLLEAEAIAIQAETELAELKLRIEQNGIEGEEEQLIWGWFHDAHLDETKRSS